MSQPGSRPQNTIDPLLRKKKLGQLYWLRVGLAATAAIVATSLAFIVPAVATNLGILVAIILYISSYFIAKEFLQVPLTKQERHKLMTQGLGSFVIFFLFVWILLTTIFFPV
jgi:hypothetical protein